MVVLYDTRWVHSFLTLTRNILLVQEYSTLNKSGHIERFSRSPSPNNSNASQVSLSNSKAILYQVVRSTVSDFQLVPSPNASEFSIVLISTFHGATFYNVKWNVPFGILSRIVSVNGELADIGWKLQRSDFAPRETNLERSTISHLITSLSGARQWEGGGGVGVEKEFLAKLARRMRL